MIANIYTTWKELAKGVSLLSVCMMISSCSQDSDTPVAPIELTTPVVELADAQATASRAAETPTAMTLKVDLLKSDGTVSKYQNNADRTCTYTLNASNWSVETGSSPLIVTDGEGQYYARALASGVTVGEVTNAFYAYTGTSSALGTITVASTGTFTLGAAMTPMTAAIKVALKDANGSALNASDYEIKLFNLKKATSWSNNEVQLTTTALHNAGEVLSGVFGHFVTNDATTGTWQLMTVSKGGVTWTVNTTGTLTLTAGQIHTFTVTLGGSSVITLSDDAEGITVGGFTDSTDGELNIER